MVFCWSHKITIYINEYMKGLSKIASVLLITLGELKIRKIIIRTVIL